MVSPPTTRVSAAGSGAPRPPGTGRGKPEVKTLRNSALNRAYGGWQFVAGLAERRATNEPSSSHAAAPTAVSFALAPSYEGDHRNWAGSVISEIYSSSGVTGDLGTAVPVTKRKGINDAVRLLRLYCGFSQMEMASKLGVAQSLVSDVEGGRKNVTMDLLESYSAAVGVRMSQLLFFAEEIDGQPIARRGQLIVADKVLQLLENLKPADREAA